MNLLFTIPYDVVGSSCIACYKIISPTIDMTAFTPFTRFELNELTYWPRSKVKDVDLYIHTPTGLYFNEYFFIKF